MGFFEAVKTCFKKYATFSGRARRSEFWFWEIFNCGMVVLIPLVTMLVMFALNGGTIPQDEQVDSGLLLLVMIISSSPVLQIVLLVLLFYSLVIVPPSLAVSVRRMHDIGKSGSYWCINLIPYVGGLIFLILTLFDSQPGENAYGPNPKEVQKSDESKDPFAME